MTVEHGAQPAQTRNVPDELARALDRQFASLCQQKGVAHTMMAIENLDGSLRWHAAAGDAQPGGELLQPETPIWIASVTKLFIASSILRLYEHGELRLDDPLTKYLPVSLIGGIHRLKGVDYTRQISVRNLLGHTSGLPEYLEAPPGRTEGLFDRILRDDRTWTLEEILQIVRGSLTPYFPPQPPGAAKQRARYSDTNFQLLIAVIETLTEKPINEAFADLLFRPLGLSNTWHPADDSEARQRPATTWHGEEPMDIPLAFRSFHDVYSTMEDLLTFMRLLVHREVFKRPSTFDLMTERWNTFSFSLSPVAPSWPNEYGLGMMRFQLPRLFTPIKPIPPMIGHSGVSGSWLFYCPILELLLAGTVDQVSRPDVPFRYLPGLVRMLDAHLRCVTRFRGNACYRSLIIH